VLLVSLEIGSRTRRERRRHTTTAEAYAECCQGGCILPPADTTTPTKNAIVAGPVVTDIVQGLLRAGGKVCCQSVLPRFGAEVATRWLSHVLLLGGRYVQESRRGLPERAPCPASLWSNAHVHAIVCLAGKFFDGVYPTTHVESCTGPASQWERDLWVPVAAEAARELRTAKSDACLLQARIMNVISWSTPQLVLTGRC